MYKLYYVRGINRLDTPYFKTLAEQETYFESKKILEIDYIYPPHYRDTIDFDITDLDMKTQANYLGIEFNNKMYYYFIDNVVYINEEMIQITITMDVIQTYMFDIDYIHCDVGRRTIDRWNDDGTINRNYLRENLSQGTMQVVGAHKYEEDFGFVIIAYTIGAPLRNLKEDNLLYVRNDANLISQGYSFAYNLSNNLFSIKNFSTDTQIAIIPYSSKYKRFNVVAKYGYTTKTDGLVFTENKTFIMDMTDIGGGELPILDSIGLIASLDNIISIKYVPYNLFNNVSIDTSGEVPILTLESISNGYGFCGLCQAIHRSYTGSTSQGDLVSTITFFELNDERILTKKANFQFDFTPNKPIQKPFDKKYIPALIDENYIQLHFGEKMSLTSFPLYQAKQTTLNLLYTTNIVDGYRLYYITDDPITEIEFDKYKTLTYVTTTENFVLFNSAWSTYLSQNQSSLTRGVRLNQIKVLFDYSKGIFSNLRQGSKLGIANQSLDSAFELYSINEKLNITKENLEYTPDTIKLGNSVNSDIISESIIPCIYYYEVNDIDKVAEQYEGYGYKVNEHYSKVNILDTLNTRYYYNIIKCEDMEINLKVLNDELTITRIKDRFNSGLRLWNISNLDENMQMGDLFVYDNVEKKYLE